VFSDPLGDVNVDPFGDVVTLVHVISLSGVGGGYLFFISLPFRSCKHRSLCVVIVVTALYTCKYHAKASAGTLYAIALCVISVIVISDLCLHC
jgi:hypothetical protein